MPSSINSLTTEKTVYSRPCDFSQLSEIQWELEQLLTPWIKHDSHLNFVTLAIIEGLANIFEHNLGQAANKNDTVDIKITRINDTSVVYLIDNGKAPPPHVCHKLTTQTSTMPRIDTDELPVSGWGLNLIEFAATSIRYQRINQRNYLELTFEDSPATDS